MRDATSQRIRDFCADADASAAVERLNVISRVCQTDAVGGTFWINICSLSAAPLAGTQCEGGNARIDFVKEIGAKGYSLLAGRKRARRSNFESRRYRPICGRCGAKLEQVEYRTEKRRVLCLQMPQVASEAAQLLSQKRFEKKDWNLYV